MATRGGWPRARRAPVGRRRRGRPSRQDARPDDQCVGPGCGKDRRMSSRAWTRAIGSSAAAPFPFRGQGIGVPTLAEVLRRYRGRADDHRNKGVYRGDGRSRRGRRSVEPTRSTMSASQDSACPAPAPRARRCPGVPASASQAEVRLALYRSWLRWPVRRAPYHTYQVPESAEGTRIVSPRFIRYAHQAGFKVQVWTVDEEADMRRLLEWGVDGLISNRPDVAVRVRATSCHGGHEGVCFFCSPRGGGGGGGGLCPNGGGGGGGGRRGGKKTGSMEGSAARRGGGGGRH